MPRRVFQNNRVRPTDFAVHPLSLSSGGLFWQAVRHEILKSLIQTRDTRSIRVFLIGVELKSRTAADVRESLAELEELATTAGTQIIGEGVQKLATPVAATYIGPGKAEEFAKSCKENDVDTVIFDDELSPAQTRNLEKIFGF